MRIFFLNISNRDPCHFFCTRRIYRDCLSSIPVKKKKKEKDLYSCLANSEKSYVLFFSVSHSSSLEIKRDILNFFPPSLIYKDRSVPFSDFDVSTFFLKRRKRAKNTDYGKSLTGATLPMPRVLLLPIWKHDRLVKS